MKIEGRTVFVVVVVIVVTALALGLMIVHAVAGEVYTWTDPKTGVKHYSDQIPPAPPTGVRVDEPANPRVIGPMYGVEGTKSPPITKEEEAQGGGPKGTYDRTIHESNRPTKPNDSVYERRFNRAFDKHERYQADLDRWRYEGYKLEEKYGTRTTEVPKGPTYKGRSIHGFR
jgi:hypothetical protein